MGKGGLKVVTCPRWGSDPASGHPKAQQPPLGRVPHRQYEVSTWTHPAHGEGCRLPLWGPDTEQ